MILKSKKAVSTTCHYAASIAWARNAQTQINQDQLLCGSPAEPTEIMSGDNAVIWKGSNIRIAEDLPFHIREIRKNFLVPALKKAKQVANVKASIVGDKFVVNGHRYTFNDIPMQWRNTQSQDQYVQAQETEVPVEPNTTVMEPPQELPEIT